MTQVARIIAWRMVMHAKSSFMAWLKVKKWKKNVILSIMMNGEMMEREDDVKVFF